MDEQMVQIDVGSDAVAAELIRAKCEDEGMVVALARADDMGNVGPVSHRLVVQAGDRAAVEALLADAGD